MRQSGAPGSPCGRDSLSVGCSLELQKAGAEGEDHTKSWVGRTVAQAQSWGGGVKLAVDPFLQIPYLTRPWTSDCKGLCKGIKFKLLSKK